MGPEAQLELLDADRTTRFRVDPDGVIRLLDVEISNRGELVAASTLGGDILVWNRRGDLWARLEGHTKRVIKLAFTSDDQTLYSASWDQSVRSWNMQAVGASVLAEPIAQWDIGLEAAMQASGP